MILPEHINLCIHRLEDRGFATYCVGGCVRDSVLGLTPHDYDLCTQATPDQIRQVFADYPLVLAGEKHGTISVVMGHELVEITTFRTEGDYDDSRHPNWVRFVSSIEEDLSRRDFTVNAMAWSPTRGFADPFGGQADLKTKTLRAVGDPTARFTEDALRILRGVRFAVRYDLTPETETERAMFALTPLMDKLARERVLDELLKLLPHVQAEDILRFAPVLVQAIPELKTCVGFEQHSPHHAYDVFTHTAHVVAAMPANPALRLTALLHDVGKPVVFYRDETGRGHFPGHAAVGAEMADAALHRLKASNDLRQRVTTLIANHMTPLEPDKRILRRRLAKLGLPGVTELLALQRADFNSKGAGEETDAFEKVEAMLQEILAEDACLSLKDLAVSGHDLMLLGYSGKAIGICLNRLLELVIDEQLPNEKHELLAKAEELRQEVTL